MSQLDQLLLKHQAVFKELGTLKGMHGMLPSVLGTGTNGAAQSLNLTFSMMPKPFNLSKSFSMAPFSE